MPKTPITIHEEAEVASKPTTAPHQARLDWAVSPGRPIAVNGLPYWIGGAGVGLLLGLILCVPFMRLYGWVFG